VGKIGGPLSHPPGKLRKQATTLFDLPCPTLRRHTWRHSAWPQRTFRRSGGSDDGCLFPLPFSGSLGIEKNGIL
jgi:hypothetical protein